MIPFPRHLQLRGQRRILAPGNSLGAITGFRATAEGNLSRIAAERQLPIPGAVPKSSICRWQSSASTVKPGL
jgi:hypothetical protein